MNKIKKESIIFERRLVHCTEHTAVYLHVGVNELFVIVFMFNASQDCHSGWWRTVRFGGGARECADVRAGGDDVLRVDLTESSRRIMTWHRKKKMKELTVTVSILAHSLNYSL